MAGVLRLFLVRHGETAENVRMRYIGTRDEPLTAKGLDQARAAASALAVLPVGCVVSSPLRRACQTARCIREACGSELRLDARLDEGSFGAWEGLSRDEVLALGEEHAGMLRRWESDPSASPPGGESIESVQRRVLDLVDGLKRESASPGVVLVSHVGPIKALLAAALDMPLQSSRRFFLDPGTISVLDLGEHPSLRLFNSHAHLGWASARWMG